MNNLSNKINVMEYYRKKAIKFEKIKDNNSLYLLFYVYYSRKYKKIAFEIINTWEFEFFEKLYNYIL